MKKLMMFILSGLLAYCCIGCTVTVTDTSSDETEEESEPEEVTEEEQDSDKEFESLKKSDEKIETSDLIGEYEIVVYTYYSYSYVKGSDDWSELFGNEEKDEDTILLTIVDKKNMIFSDYGDISKITYTLSGNVLTFEEVEVEDEMDEEESTAATQALYVDGIIVMDLNGSKMYFGKRGVESDIEKAKTLEEQIESNSTEDGSIGIEIDLGS